MSSGVVFTAWGAHPRACGENGTTGSGLFLFRGSSPRMRGKQHLRIRDQLSNGLIPAHAGKTDRPAFSAVAAGAHPRACGENRVSPRSTAAGTGSSPRMRGKQVDFVRPAAPAGLIPAHAGKTSGFRVSVGPSRAHPRACGENQSERPTANRPSGSSPRMRGKLINRLSRQSRQGLIPAHAGKTLNDLEF